MFVVKGLSLLLLTSLAFHNFGADGNRLQSASDFMTAAECFVPRLLNKVPFLQYSDTTTCPKILDSEDKKYCCLNSDFQVECCDLVQYAVFGLICLTPVISILSAVCCCCICCFCKKVLPCC